LIVPCGLPDHAVTSLKNEFPAREVQMPEQLPSLEAVAHRAAREFGLVFDQRVLAVESLAALRARADAEAPAPPDFPAEDTPLRVPAEVERLRGNAAGPTRIC
jgi:lipoyl(octanoyl) transferase